MLKLVNTVETEARRIADDLGDIRAQIAALKERERGLVADFILIGEEAAEGALFRAKLVEETTRDKTDWEKIARDLGASPQRIRANTTSVTVKASVRTYGRKQT